MAPTRHTATEVDRVIILKNNDTGAFIGTITQEQLQSLIDALEEETEEDQDYWINRASLEIMRQEGGDAALLDMIEKAMGAGDEIEIAWEDE